MLLPDTAMAHFLADVISWLLFSDKVTFERPTTKLELLLYRNSSSSAKAFSPFVGKICSSGPSTIVQTPTPCIKPRSGKYVFACVCGLPIYTTGKIGQAIVLDGVDDVVNVGALGISGAAPRTIAGWIRFSGRGRGVLRMFIALPPFRGLYKARTGPAFF